MLNLVQNSQEFVSLSLHLCTLNDKILEMLNDSLTYEEITANKDKVVVKLIKELACNHSHSLTEKEVNYLCHFDFKTSGFYGLPKIHKSKIICQEAKVQKKPYMK